MFCVNLALFQTFTMENKPQKKYPIRINFNAKNWSESAKKMKETYDEYVASVRSKWRAECKEHDVKVKELKKNHEKMTNLIKKESADKYDSMVKERDELIVDHDNEIKNLKKNHEKMINFMKKESADKYDLMVKERDELIDIMSKEHDANIESLQTMYDDTVALRDLDQERLIACKQKYIELKNNYNEVNYNNAELEKLNAELKKSNKDLKDETVDTNLKYQILFARFGDLNRFSDKTSAHVTSLQNDKSELRVEIERSNGAINMLKRDIEDLENKVKYLTTKLDETIAKEQNTLKASVQMNSDNEEKIKSLSSKLDESNQKLKKTIDMNNQTNTEYNKIKALYETLKAQVT